MPHTPRKRFGQHFLHDPAVIDRIVMARKGVGVTFLLPGTADHLSVEIVLHVRLTVNFGPAQPMMLQEAGTIQDFSTSHHGETSEMKQDLTSPPDLTREKRLSFFEPLPDVERSRVDFSTVRGVQFLEPLFEFPGSCAG